MFKRGLITLLVLLVVACLCACALFVPAAALASPVAARYLPFLPTFTPTPGVVIKTPVVVPQTAAEIPSNWANQMDQIQTEVSQIRGLSLTQPFSRFMLSTDQLKDKVKQDFFKDYTRQQAEDDALFYSTLGLLKPDSDLMGIYQDLYSEQVAGYYDAETKQMFIVQNEGFNGTERMTYAHEFTHTLQDQHYDLRGRMKITEDYCRQHGEYCSAVTALVEGDAVSSEQSWFYTNASPQDHKQVQEFYGRYQSPVFDSSPEFIKEDLLFPYQKGFEFVQSLYDLGGWQAVDKAFINAPVSTAQILHPALYPDVKPVDVILPDVSLTLGNNWRLAEQGSLGEWYSLLLLSKGWNERLNLPDNEAQQAAAGWAGDRYLFYRKTDDPKQFALVVEWKWASLEDADQFWTAFTALNKQRWDQLVQESSLDMRWENKDGSRISVRYTQQGTRWIVTSDQNTLDLVRSAFK